jgi:ribonuclease BN (tRNA processing enzyme)
MGKGNMVLVQFSNGINMLVDCNSVEGRPSPLEYLRSKIRTLDFVLITHPHQDHLTGLQEICTYFRPKYLWHNGRYFKPDPVYDDWTFYEKLRGGGYSYCTSTRVQAGQTATIGTTRLHILGPTTPHSARAIHDLSPGRHIRTRRRGSRAPSGCTSYRRDEPRALRRGRGRTIPKRLVLSLVCLSIDDAAIKEPPNFLREWTCLPPSSRRRTSTSLKCSCSCAPSCHFDKRIVTGFDNSQAQSATKLTDILIPSSADSFGD